MIWGGGWVHVPLPSCRKVGGSGRHCQLGGVRGRQGGWETLINPDLSRATNQRRRKTAAVGPRNATTD